MSGGAGVVRGPGVLCGGTSETSNLENDGFLTLLRHCADALLFYCPHLLFLARYGNSVRQVA